MSRLSGPREAPLEAGLAHSSVTPSSGVGPCLEATVSRQHSPSWLRTTASPFHSWKLGLCHSRWLGSTNMGDPQRAMSGWGPSLGPSSTRDCSVNYTCFPWLREQITTDVPPTQSSPWSSKWVRSPEWAGGPGDLLSPFPASGGACVPWPTPSASVLITSQALTWPLPPHEDTGPPG